MRPAVYVRAATAAVITTAALAVPTVASAHIAHIAHIDHSITHAGAAATYGADLRHPHAKRTRNAHNTHAKTPAPSPTQNPTSVNYKQPTNTGVQYVEADDEQACAKDDDPSAFMQQRHATVMRLVVQPYFLATDEALKCVQDARAEGYRIYLSVAFNSTAPAPAVAGYVAQVISTYGPVSFIALGNEEDLGNGWTPNAAEDADQYFQMWQAVEPTIAADDPGAIRVLADASPWALGWLERVVADGPTGAQAAAYHCYDMQNGTGMADVPTLAAFMAAHGLPLECSEMAPAITATNGCFVLESQASYQGKVNAMVGASPDVQMVSWYEWPNIGATTPGIA